ncbi:MAG: sugar-binding domain-containing protein [Selenomonas noxia]|uniref:sugar-binding domain-containing protein n=1 Tax=Selenomonas noxia TaxID=135083 RepID=UPI0036220FD3
MDCGTRYSQFIRETKTAAELERLRSLRCSIGMAASREKVPAILGALRGRYINVLITDEETAKILLNE